jgi:hypothetical protein
VCGTIRIIYFQQIQGAHITVTPATTIRHESLQYLSGRESAKHSTRSMTSQGPVAGTGEGGPCKNGESRVAWVCGSFPGRRLGVRGQSRSSNRARTIARGGLRGHEQRIERGYIYTVYRYRCLNVSNTSATGSPGNNLEVSLACREWTEDPSSQWRPCSPTCGRTPVVTISWIVCNSNRVRSHDGFKRYHGTLASARTYTQHCQMLQAPS